MPREINEEAMIALDHELPPVAYGTPLSKAFDDSTFIPRLLAVPAVAGALLSLVGPEPDVDHHAVHVRGPHEGEAQNLRGDAVIDVRPDAFDLDDPGVLRELATIFPWYVQAAGRLEIHNRALLWRVLTGDDSDEPPYASGLDALLDGWRLFQCSQLLPPYPGHEYDTSFLTHEFFLEKFGPADAGGANRAP